MFFCAIVVLVLVGVGVFLAYNALFCRDVDGETARSGVLWKAVGFEKLGPENAELVLLMKQNAGGEGQYVLKSIDHKVIGEFEDWEREGRGEVEMVYADGWRKVMVRLPGQDGERMFGDSVVFWDGQTQSELFLVSREAEQKWVVALEDREYDIYLPAGSPRELARVEIDDEVVAEFARADRLAFRRAHLIALRWEDMSRLLPILVFLSVARHRLQPYGSSVETGLTTERAPYP